ncbi:hypothetical protein SAY87_027885 [Trapa incisa]|uniref:Exocyst subunit Exo70 family protein n=1 Tax=Trapa incisa TaxID=236973 RepID=A0AAN7L131_9MYRT|nr:hypothetical protein SAY87_027885 [Trapa incisa]
MRSLCFQARTPSFAFPSSRASPVRSISAPELAMERVIQLVEPVILKWNPDFSTYARVTSLFYEEKTEALEFVKCVNDLQQAMQSLVSEDSNSEKLVRAHWLMQMAMKRLQKELYQILSLNRSHLDPESVSVRSSRTSISTRSSASDDDVDEGDDDRRDAHAAGASSYSSSEVEEVYSIAMADLKSITDCMISSGYGKECIGIYKVVRKSIIEEGIYRLGVEKLSASQVQKMKWEAVETKIKSWLDAVKVSIKTFYGERVLCDHVFASSKSVRESCFGEITRDGAALLFEFPELIARNTKKSPSEKMFRLLDMYTAVSENWPEIEVVFSFSSTAAVRSIALNSLIRLGQSVQASLGDFQSKILKDSFKPSIVPGCGVHPLTIDTMNFLCLLADYRNVLDDIIVSEEKPKSPARPPLPESYFDSPDRDSNTSAPAISVRIAWLVLVLLCKLDGKSKKYNDVSFSYLFLANNLQYVVSKVRSSNLHYLLGDDWIQKQEEKINQFAASYERIGWGNVLGQLQTIEEKSSREASLEETFKRFNSSFDSTYRRQSSSTVPDQELRERIKMSIEQKILPAYRALYDSDTHRAESAMRRRRIAQNSVVKYEPEDISRRISELFSDPKSQRPVAVTASM